MGAAEQSAQPLQDGPAQLAHRQPAKAATWLTASGPASHTSIRRARRMATPSGFSALEPRE